MSKEAWEVVGTAEPQPEAAKPATKCSQCGDTPANNKCLKCQRAYCLRCAGNWEDECPYCVNARIKPKEAEPVEPGEFVKKMRTAYPNQQTVLGEALARIEQLEGELAEAKAQAKGWCEQYGRKHTLHENLCAKRGDLFNAGVEAEKIQTRKLKAQLTSANAEIAEAKKQYMACLTLIEKLDDELKAEKF